MSSINFTWSILEYIVSDNTCWLVLQAFLRTCQSLHLNFYYLFIFIVFFLEGGKARKYGVLLEQEATVKILKKALSELSNIPMENLMLVEVVGPTIKVCLLFVHSLQ